MDQCLDFEIGPYRGMLIEAADETGYVNKLMNAVIAASRYAFDEEGVAAKAVDMASALEAGLEADRKPVKAFCYLNGIPEGGLADWCAEEYKRGALEDAVIVTVARREGVEVTEADLSEYRRGYLERYSRALFDGMGVDEEPLKKAVLAKKTLKFLMEANEWVRQ